MCKNWEVFGRCYYQNTCSFAHGEQELMKKEHLKSNFKSRPCVVFHRTAFCPYGSRCVFSHLQYNIYKPKKLTYQKILNENVRVSLDRLIRLKDASLNGVVYIDSFSGIKGFGKRLDVFSQITLSTQPYQQKSRKQKIK